MEFGNQVEVDKSRNYMEKPNSKVILFDGVCNLCNGFVNFVIDRDGKNRFKFGALQSESGMKLLAQFSISVAEQTSVVLIDDGRYSTKSSAILHITRKLNWPWPAMFMFILIPKFLRDKIYDLIAKNRYEWFGKRDKCMVPTAELLERFL